MLETDKYDIWTYDTREEWTALNCGIADRLLIHGLARDAATRAAEQLAGFHPEDTYEVRDYKSDVVHTFGTARPDLAEATRTRLAGRRRRPLARREA